MGNILRGVFYTGLAATVGVVGYIAGKSKHWKGISLTTMGLALILYTPRGCDLLEKYAIIRGEIAKAKIYGVARKDSLDAALRIEEKKDSSRTYVWNAIREVSSLEKNLEDSYGVLLKNTEDKYDALITENNIKYADALRNMEKQNAALKKNIDALVDMQKKAGSAKASVEFGGSSTEKNSFPRDGSPSNNSSLIADRDTSSVHVRSTFSAQKSSHSGTPDYVNVSGIPKIHYKRNIFGKKIPYVVYHWD